MIIDIHSHFISVDLVNNARKGTGFDGISIQKIKDREFVCHRQGSRYPLSREFFDLEAKLANMDLQGIEVSLLSIAPTLFMYWAVSMEAEEFCMWMNNCLADFISSSGGRMRGLASVPLQAPKLAVRELRRAILELGFCGAQIGASVEEMPLDDIALTPFFEAASELGVPLLIHPYAVGKRARMADFHLNNLVGNPLDTELAAARMIFSGFLDRFPDLSIILAHGGGFLPYQIGRFAHAHQGQANKAGPAHSPLHYLKRFFYDTVLFEPQPLAFLCEMAGPTQLMVGTDIPFGAQDVHFKENIEGLAIAQKEKDLIFSRNAQRVFGLS